MLSRAQRNLSYQDSNILLKFAINCPEYTVSAHFPTVACIHETQYETQDLVEQRKL